MIIYAGHVAGKTIDTYRPNLRLHNRPGPMAKYDEGHLQLARLRRERDVGPGFKRVAPNISIWNTDQKWLERYVEYAGEVAKLYKAPECPMHHSTPLSFSRTLSEEKPCESFVSIANGRSRRASATLFKLLPCVLRIASVYFQPIVAIGLAASLVATSISCSYLHRISGAQ